MISDDEAVAVAREQLAAAGAATGVARAAGVAEKAAAERLLQEALHRGSLDNTTVVVVVLPWE